MRQSSNSSARSAELILLLVGLGSALCYAAALVHFPLLRIYAQPIQNLEKLTKADLRTGLVLTGWTLLVFAGYAMGAVVLARNPRGGAGVNERDRDRPRTPAPPHPLTLTVVLVGFPLIFLALLVLVYPTTSVDLYDYMFRGRMLARYQANTFTQVPIEFNTDPLFWYVAWRKAVTAYGPLWEGMSWLTARLAGERPNRLLYGQAAQFKALLQLMLAYKGLSALGFLGCGAAIWFTLRRTAFAWRWLGLYLWLWNPLALWESLAAGHNDAWMAMLIVLAVGLLTWDTGRRSQVADQVTSDAPTVTPSPRHLVILSVAAFLVLTAGGLVKFLALMFGPLLLCAALRRMPDWRARLRLVLAGGLTCAAAVVLAYAPFWVGWGTLRNFGERGALFTSSWLAALQAPIESKVVHALLPARDLLALVSIGQPSEAISQAIAVRIGLGLLIFGVLWASWRAWRAPEDVAAHALWLLLWFLFLCNPWFQPWYILWALALLAIQPWRGRHVWAIGLFCATAMLSYLSGGFLLPLFGWKDTSAEWNALTSVLIYGPPLLALLPGERFGRARSRRALLSSELRAREKEIISS